MDLAARWQWAPASVSPTDASASSATHGSSVASASSHRESTAQRDDPLKQGRKVRKDFVDEDTGER
jgi:hypothetical protein